MTTAGDVELDLVRATWRVDGRSGALSDNEVALLRYLAERPGIVVPRDTLLAQALGYHASASSRAVENSISRLRKKLDGFKALRSVYGEGYALDVRVDGLYIARPALEEALREALQKGGLVTLVGPPGSGKTALARCVAPWVPHVRPDGKGLTAFAGELGLAHTPSPQHRAQAVALALSARGGVVVDEPGDVTWLGPLYDAATPNVLLVRHQPSGLPSETVVRMRPIPVDERAAWIERLAKDGGNTLAQGDAHRLAAAAGGWPAELVLLVSWLRVLTVDELLERMHDPNVTGDGQALLTCLPDTARTVLGCMAVFQSACTLDELEAVCGITPSIVTDLASLQSHGVVRRSGRKRIIEASYQRHARAILEGMQDADAVRSRHARCMAQWVRDGHEPWMRPNDLTAAWGVAHGDDGLTLALAVDDCLERTTGFEARLRHLDSAIQRNPAPMLVVRKASVLLAGGQRAAFERTLTTIRPGPPRLDARVALLRARGMVRRDNARAVELAEQALDAFQRLADRHGEAEALSELSVRFGYEGDVRRAIDCANEAIAVFRGNGRGALSRPVHSRLYAQIAMGDVDGAMRDLREVLSWAFGERNRALLLLMRGGLYLDVDNREAAGIDLRAAFEQASRLGDLYCAAESLRLASVIDALDGRFMAAHRSLLRAEELATRQTHRLMMMSQSATVWLLGGEPERALALLRDVRAPLAELLGHADEYVDAYIAAASSLCNEAVGEAVYDDPVAGWVWEAIQGTPPPVQVSNTKERWMQAVARAVLSHADG